MAKKKEAQPGEYIWPHPRFKKSTDKKWLEGRNKHVTGFCSPHNPLAAQGHEGTKPVSVSGQPLKVCEFYETCPCTCHQEVDQMYELTGLPREGVEQSAEYMALVHERETATRAMLDSLVVSSAIAAPLSMSGGPDVHPSDEGPSTGTAGTVTGTPAAPAQPLFAPTPTGRRARGQLEYDVLTVCSDFQNGVFDWTICTPKLVSEEIGKRYAIEPPSTGAINAVWDRWEKLDFAKQDKKPSRFVGFTGDYTPAALETIKARNKRAKRRGEAEAKRGSLRPRGR